MSRKRTHLVGTEPCKVPGKLILLLLMQRGAATRWQMKIADRNNKRIKRQIAGREHREREKENSKIF